MTRVEKHAPAKINLYLHVTGKRGDGYHLLDSLAVFARELSDVIVLEPAARFAFSVAGPYADGLAGEDNLAVRAAKLYCEAVGVAPDFHLHLEKNIPVGAGLGGGSSDAAATIKALEEFFGKPLPDRSARLLSLGADVPVCYRGKTARFKGVGEILHDVPDIPPLDILIVWPACHSATRDVFAAQTPTYQKPVSFPQSYSTLPQFLFFLKDTHNDLTTAATGLAPDIGEALKIMSLQDECALARMSGSGSSVFGIFRNANACRNAEKLVATHHPDWWVRATTIL